MIQRLVPEICIKHLHVFLLADCLISFDNVVLIVEGSLKSREQSMWNFGGMLWGQRTAQCGCQWLLCLVSSVFLL